MSAAPTVGERLTDLIRTFEPRTRPAAIGRTALALATATTLVFTPAPDRFIKIAGRPSGIDCDGVHALSGYCVGSQLGLPVDVLDVLVLAVLLVAASGLLPRWTCVPHWYATFSLTSALALPDGGDHIAQIATLLLIPICLGDRRLWHWQTARDPMSERWSGASYAAHLCLRLQLAIVYLVAALSKLTNGTWRDGIALRAVVFDPEFGSVRAVRRILGPMAGNSHLAAVAGCSVIALELAVGLLILGRIRSRRIACALIALFHSAIILFMGLAGFGVIMISVAALTLSARIVVGEKVDAGPPSGDVLAVGPSVTVIQT